MALSIKVKETGPPFTTTMTCGMNDKSAVWQKLRLRDITGWNPENLTGKVHWYQFHVVSWSISCSCYSCSHSRQHPNRNNMFQKQNIQNTFPAEMHLQNVFFFFRESNSAKLHEAHVLSGWMGYSLASHSPNLRYYKGLTDSVEIFGEMGCSEHINTTSTNLPQLYGMLMSIRIFIYIYIYISYLFGERDDIHIFYTVNCCIQRMYPWLETQPLKFSSSSPSYRNCDSVCLSSLQSIPWRRPNKQRHTRKSTFAAHVGAIQSLNVLIFV